MPPLIFLLRFELSDLSLFTSKLSYLLPPICCFRFKIVVSDPYFIPVPVSCRVVSTRARAGADVVSPSDMMDGRIGAIRAALDADGFQHVSIMSYTAKYQMNPANCREALVETREDETEGADILLVKPGLPYLDIIRLLRDNSPLPIAAYQASGEYSMIKAGGQFKMIDEERVMMETLMCLRRAGADVVFSHFALQAARCLCGEELKCM
ncbi:Delta-aminolevulinic acid dehydratase 1 [Abeliophyllum distichum]|uniref:Delta-aminolevulinic acid dehydratase n=1 Tax=Abeliophyllum distichum TaxID=126358 RepID=A0ABD1STC1_9LAMI